MRWALRLEKMMHEAHALSLTHDLDRGNATSLGVASGGRGSTPMPLVTSVISVSSSSLMACTFIMVGVWGSRCRFKSTLPPVVVRRAREGRDEEETRKRRGRDEEKMSERNQKSLAERKPMIERFAEMWDGGEAGPS